MSPLIVEPPPRRANRPTRPARQNRRQSPRAGARRVPPTRPAAGRAWPTFTRPLQCHAAPFAAGSPVADLPPRTLTALPVYNEVAHLRPVLGEVRRYVEDMLVVDDGSTDGSGPLLDEIAAEWAAAEGCCQLTVLHQPANRGYGAALSAAFDAAVELGFERLVMIDCDGQHQPALIPELAAGLDGPEPVDILSGSRYLAEFAGDSDAPEDRRAINRLVTRFLNARLGSALGVTLTDSFCGFKAYRVAALPRLNVTDPGYAMPLQLWVQAAAAGLRVAEYPVPRVYLEEERSFGGSLDKSAARLAHYSQVLTAELNRRPELPREPDAAAFLVLPDAAPPAEPPPPRP